jgi:hypothetical protein
MKTPLPPLIQSHLATVAAIADGLAATACQVPARKLAGINVAGILDNLDYVAGCLTWKELEHAPAMLNAAARAFREAFPSDSLGWEDAARLTLIADAIAKAWEDEQEDEDDERMARHEEQSRQPWPDDEETA